MMFNCSALTVSGYMVMKAQSVLLLTISPNIKINK